MRFLPATVGRQPTLVTEGWVRRSKVAWVTYTPGSRDQFVAGAQVQSGKQGFASQTSPGHDLPRQAEKPSEQAIGAADAPGTDQLAYARAADPGSADYHLRADADLKVEFPAELLKQRDVAGAAISERKVAPDENLPRPENPDHDLPHELFACHSGQGSVKVQNGKHLQPAGAQQPNLLLRGSDRPGALSGASSCRGWGWKLSRTDRVPDVREAFTRVSRMRW